MRWSVPIACLLLAAPASGQEGAAPPPAEAPAPAQEAAPVPAAGEAAAPEEPAAEAKPAEVAPRPPSSRPTPPPQAPDGTDPALLDAVARFFGALREGDAAGAAAACATPFRLEAEDLTSGWELRRRLGEILASRPLLHVPLHGIELLDAARMKERHGPPPSRLGGVPLDGAHVAVANFGGKAVVAVFRADGRGYRAVALTE